MSELFEIVNNNPWKKRLPWLLLAAAVLVALGAWYFAGYGHNPRVDTKAAELSGATQTAERRADAVVDSVSHKEVTARADVKKRVAAMEPDSIVDTLGALLTESRREK